MIKFGVAGNSKSFYEEGFEKTVQAASWCKNKGIDVFEYSFGQGVRLSKETALQVGQAFLENGVEITAHSPYYINFANQDPEMISKSINYVRQSIIKLDELKGNRVVVHPAAQGKTTREIAVKTCKDNLIFLDETLKAEGFLNFKICLETMGKSGQIGTLDEIIEFVNLSDMFYPCIDFGHINAREQGILNSKESFKTVLKKMLDNLPLEKVKFMHSHFSKIKYGAKGELYHLTFEDNIYGPKFEDLAEWLDFYNLEPIIICESDGTQAEDAILMKNYYNKIKKQ